MDLMQASIPDDLEAAFLALRHDLVRRARAIEPRGDAEDVVQEVWIRLRSITEPVGNPRAYLMRTVYTVVLDRRRTQRRSAARDGSWVTAQRPDGGDADPADAESLLLARESLAAVHARLAALGEPANTIFRRYRFGGEPQKHIAETLGIALRTVEKHLHRAYAAIHQLRSDQDD